ncbi:hypothetical protein FIBSPDRAFT_65797 [Athelia psychrophila]|uniref:Uncharacterized protein n=1 Tax=Athelia psychrophila TaxID=1759441 RepID=A0A166EXN5_9AGAM|nr:hypothetical protein FIBSPDRAFT_65797 [Fibularhizoctonia sp. CBS 109695]
MIDSASPNRVVGKLDWGHGPSGHRTGCDRHSHPSHSTAQNITDSIMIHERPSTRRRTDQLASSFRPPTHDCSSAISVRIGPSDPGDSIWSMPSDHTPNMSSRPNSGFPSPPTAGASTTQIEARITNHTYWIAQKVDGHRRRPPYGGNGQLHFHHQEVASYNNTHAMKRQAASRASRAVISLPEHSVYPV